MDVSVVRYIDMTAFWNIEDISIIREALYPQMSHMKFEVFAGNLFCDTL